MIQISRHYYKTIGTGNIFTRSFSAGLVEIEIRPSQPEPGTHTGRGTIFIPFFSLGLKAIFFNSKKMLFEKQKKSSQSFLKVLQSFENQYERELNRHWWNIRGNILYHSEDFARLTFFYTKKPW